MVNHTGRVIKAWRYRTYHHADPSQGVFYWEPEGQAFRGAFCVTFGAKSNKKNVIK